MISRSRSRREAITWVTLVPAAILVVASPVLAGSCTGPLIAQTHVAGVTLDGSLTLSDGQTVRLAGLRLERRAIALLAALTGKRVELFGYAPLADRYGRLRAQVFADGHWVQQDLLVQGQARVFIDSDRYECAEALYRIETTARAARVGLWADPANAVRTPTTVEDFIGSFQLVEGRVLAAARKQGRVFLNFGADWRQDFTVTIAPQDAKAFRRRKFDPLRLEGSRIRVRGFVQSYRGPEIEVAIPEQIEVLD